MKPQSVSRSPFWLAAALLLSLQVVGAMQDPDPKAKEKAALQTLGQSGARLLQRSMAGEQAATDSLHTLLHDLPKDKDTFQLLCSGEAFKVDGQAGTSFLSLLLDYATMDKEKGARGYALIQQMEAEGGELQRLGQLARRRWLAWLQTSATDWVTRVDALLGGLPEEALVDGPQSLYSQLTTKAMRDRIVTHLIMRGHKMAKQAREEEAQEEAEEERRAFWERLFQFIIDCEAAKSAEWFTFFFSYGRWSGPPERVEEMRKILLGVEVTWSSLEKRQQAAPTRYTGNLLHYILYHWYCEPPIGNTTTDWDKLVTSFVGRMSPDDLQQVLTTPIPSGDGQVSTFAELMATIQAEPALTHLMDMLPKEKVSQSDTKAAEKRLLELKQPANKPLMHYRCRQTFGVRFELEPFGDKLPPGLSYQQRERRQVEEKRLKAELLKAAGLRDEVTPEVDLQAGKEFWEVVSLLPLFRASAEIQARLAKSLLGWTIRPSLWWEVFEHPDTGGESIRGAASAHDFFSPRSAQELPKEEERPWPLVKCFVDKQQPHETEKLYFLSIGIWPTDQDLRGGSAEASAWKQELERIETQALFTLNPALKLQEEARQKKAQEAQARELEEQKKQGLPNSAGPNNAPKRHAPPEEAGSWQWRALKGIGIGSIVVGVALIAVAAGRYICSGRLSRTRAKRRPRQMAKVK